MNILAAFWSAACMLVTCDPEPVRVLFFANGASGAGHEVVFPDSRITHTAALASLEGTPVHHPDAELFSHLGEVMADLSACQDGDRLYVVPRSQFFFWPFVEVGHRVNVPNMAGKTDVWLESISESPRAFYLHNFLEAGEADKLRDNALAATGKEAMEKSTVGVELRENRDMNDAASFASTRTSDNAWDMGSPTAQPVIDRSFMLGRIPLKAKYQDGLQLLRYQQRQAYHHHHDFFPIRGQGDQAFNFDPQTGGANRLLTIFLYISDVEEGGQTVFAQADPLKDDELAKLSPSLRPLMQSHKKSKENVTALVNDLFPKGTWQPGMVRDCYNKLSIQPKKNSALLFYSMKPDLTMDPRSQHGGCPVLKGTKWGANMWLWNNMRFGHTPTNDMPIDVTFTNDHQHKGDLVWLKQGKTGDTIASLEPGESFVSHTFHSHRFGFRLGGKLRGAPFTAHANMGVTQRHFFKPQGKGRRMRPDPHAQPWPHEEL